MLVQLRVSCPSEGTTWSGKKATHLSELICCPLRRSSPHSHTRYGSDKLCLQRCSQRRATVQKLSVLTFVSHAVFFRQTLRPTIGPEGKQLNLGKPNEPARQRSVLSNAVPQIDKSGRWGDTHFQMKRLTNVRTEMALHVFAYNLKRVMVMIGVGPLIAAMKAEGRRRCVFRQGKTPTMHVFTHAGPDADGRAPPSGATASAYTSAVRAQTACGNVRQHLKTRQRTLARGWALAGSDRLPQAEHWLSIFIGSSAPTD